ncbi:hypothetical protein [Trichothermofontia sp.]
MGTSIILKRAVKPPTSAAYDGVGTVANMGILRGVLREKRDSLCSLGGLTRQLAPKS